MSDFDLDHLPQRELSAARQAVLRQELMASITPKARRRKRVWWIGAATAGVVVAGAGGAAAYLTAQSTPPTSSVYCYSMPQAGAGHDFPGTTITLVGANGASAVVGDAVDTCAQAWRDGVLVLGSRVVGTDITPMGHHAVPELVACVRTDGTVAVMPGEPEVCRTVGMAPFAGYEK